MKYLIEGVTRNEAEYTKVLTVRTVLDNGDIKFTSGHRFSEAEYVPSLYTRTGRRVAKYITLTEIV
jgi:hypothetical protein